LPKTEGPTYTIRDIIDKMITMSHFRVLHQFCGRDVVPSGVFTQLACGEDTSTSAGIEPATGAPVLGLVDIVPPPKE
jgi:hypothetical protein